MTPTLTATTEIDATTIAAWFAGLDHDQKAAFLNAAGKVCDRRFRCERIDGVYIAEKLDDAGTCRRSRWMRMGTRLRWMMGG